MLSHLRRRLDSERVRYAESRLFWSVALWSLCLSKSFRLRLLSARGMSQREVRKHGQLLDRFPTACFTDPLLLCTVVAKSNFYEPSTINHGKPVVNAYFPQLYDASTVTWRLPKNDIFGSLKCKETVTFSELQSITL